LPEHGGNQNGHRYKTVLQQSLTLALTDDVSKSSIVERSHDAMVDIEACFVLFRGLVEGGHVKFEGCCKPKKEDDKPITSTRLKRRRL
jgi:hypothetical protein